MPAYCGWFEDSGYHREAAHYLNTFCYGHTVPARDSCYGHTVPARDRCYGHTVPAEKVASVTLTLLETVAMVTLSLLETVALLEDLHVSQKTVGSNLGDQKDLEKGNVNHPPINQFFGSRTECLHSFYILDGCKKAFGKRIQIQVIKDDIVNDIFAQIQYDLDEEGHEF